jgi:hypothetical protein
LRKEIRETNRRRDDRSNQGRNAHLEEEMKRTKIIGLIAVLAMLLASCTGDDAGDTTTTAGSDDPTTTEAPDEVTTTEVMDDTTTTAGGGGDNPLAEFGEDPSAADPALIEKALGPVDPSDESSWNIILASVARANQELDQATIDKAMECWREQQCDTGSGGERVMGYADGGGNDVNVWRAVSHMEAILQALTYPEIGTIISTAANFDPDPAVHENDLRFPSFRRPRRRVFRTSRSPPAMSDFPDRKVPSPRVRTTPRSWARICVRWAIASRTP